MQVVSGWSACLVAQVRNGHRCGVNAHLKVPCLVAGMAAGADSIDDLDVPRHGAMAGLFGGIRAPSTLGSFLRSFTWGNVRQLDAVARRFLASLAAEVPLLPGGEVLAFIDMDSMQKRVYGHAKQGAGFGNTKIQGKALLVRGLNTLAAVISTPLAAPVIAATRLRGGSAGSSRGAASLIAEATSTARQARCTGQLIVRIDSAYYSAAVLGAIRAAGARFSVTAPLHRNIRAAIASIPEDDWTPATYPRAVWDEDQQRLISAAQVAEVPYTAFASKKKGQAITAPLIIRRVRDLNPQGRRRPGQAVRLLALPRRAHRLAVRDDPGRGHITLHLPEGWHATTSGRACSKPPAARRPQRPDQPRPGHRTPTAPVASRQHRPSPEPDKPQKDVSGEKTTPQKQRQAQHQLLVAARRTSKPTQVDRGLVPAASLAAHPCGVCGQWALAIAPTSSCSGSTSS